MIFLYILLATALAAAVLLSFPVIADISYGEELAVKVRYLFFKFQLLPQEEQEEKKPQKKKSAGNKKKKPQPPQEESDPMKKIRELIRLKGFWGFLDFLKEIVVILAKSGWALLKHVKLKNVDVYVCVGADDPADAAVLYGNICSVVYPSMAFIQNFFRSKDGRVTVDLDYGRDKPAVVASGSARVAAFYVLKEVIILLVRGLPYIMEFAKSENSNKSI